MDSALPIPNRNRRNHVLVSGAIVLAAAALLGVLSYGLMIDPTRVPPANIDQSAKSFTVAFVQGETLLPGAKEPGRFSLADFKGRPVILNFWASWCVSCRQEAHELEKFWEGNKEKVAVVGIAIQDQKDEAKKFATYYGKTYILGLDEDGKAAIDYGVSGVPETFLIDRNGVIRHKEIGPVDTALLEKLLPQIL